MYWGSDLQIDNSHQLNKQTGVKTFEVYAELYTSKVNNKELVIKNTYKLNELLHKYGISERIRSQFVGTCLLSLKKDLKYKGLSSTQITGGMKGVLDDLLEKDTKRAEKVVILYKNVLDSQDIRDIKAEELEHVLFQIEADILPYINDKNTMGQDILNLFFTTFNKYVGKTDKNQAFTPDHITRFMSKITNVNKDSKVLDPCCGSGAFLVSAMTEAFEDCERDKEKEIVKKAGLYGIEFEEKAFGLATTNMLIHGDGNSNVVQGSCFERDKWIKDHNIDVVLMNPPYNAQQKHCLKSYTKNWKSKKSQDPSKGFHFVHHISNVVKKGKLAALLPMNCAIAIDNKEMKKYKELMLENHTLEAVFSLPNDLFQPGASASPCCMVFELGRKHQKGKKTFFGYFKDDGFVKKKNLGRVERIKEGTTEGVWSDIESKWLKAYINKEEITGLSVLQEVSATDEWCAEAYMETDYGDLTDKDFEKSIREFVAFQVKNGII